MLRKFCAYGFLKNLRFFEPFLYLFFLARGLNFFQIGLLISIREITVYVLEIPTGVVADLIGKRRSMIAVFVSYIVSFVIFYFGHSFYIFIPAFVLFGLGEALRSGTHKAIIFDWLETQGLGDKKSKYYGITRSWSKLGSALNAILAGALVFFRGNYEIVFLASIIPYIGDLLLMISYPRTIDRKLPKGFLKRLWQDTLPLVKDIFTNFKQIKYLTVGVVNNAFYNGTFKATKDYLQPILKSYVLLLPVFLSTGETQRAALIIGAAYFIIELAGSAASRNAHRIEGLFGKRNRAINLSYWITMLIFAGATAFIHFKIFAPIILLFLIYYILQNCRYTSLVSYVADYTPPEHRSTVLSVQAQLRALFVVVMAPIYGFVADRIGLAGVFAVAFVIFAIIGPFIRVRKETP
ncbi:MFS transporter [bacterium]|nr:MAG: MFS transporter [bacterium]